MSVKAFVSSTGLVIVEHCVRGLNGDEKLPVERLTLSVEEAIELLGAKNPVVVEAANQNRAKDQQRLKDLEVEVATLRQRLNPPKVLI